MKKKTMSSPYREVASRLKKLLSEGMVIEGSLYRSDRGATPRHQLSDRAAGKYRARSSRQCNFRLDGNKTVQAV